MRINNISNRWLVIPAAVVTVLLLIGWYFIQPISFPAFEPCDRIEVTYAQLPPGLTEQSSHTLFPTSNQWEEAEDLLGRSSYHRCWKTLGGESSIESIGPQTLSLYGYSREGDLVLDLTITSGQYIRLNDRVYEMGQFGATPAAELVQKLSQALGFATF